MTPIYVSVYNRFDHLKQCLDSLLRCKESGETELFISSDAPGREEDREVINRIRDHIASLKGFAKITPICPGENWGLLKIYTHAFTEVFKKYDRIIFLEDDVVVAPDFLSYMNNALNYYERDERIYSVSSFSFSLFGHAPEEGASLYFSNRFCPWGFGTWRSKYLLHDSYSLDEISRSLRKKEFVDRLNRCGEDLLPGFAGQVAEGKPLVLDFLNTFHMVKNNLFTVIPHPSKSYNIGHDGSGSRTIRNGQFLKADLSFLVRERPIAMTAFEVRLVDSHINRLHFASWKNHAKVALWRLGLLGATRKLLR